jgi:hypothetical protein
MFVVALILIEKCTTYINRNVPDKTTVRSGFFPLFPKRREEIE